MSVIVKKEDLDNKTEAKLLRDSKIRELRTNFAPYPKTHKLYAETKTEYIFPRAIGIEGKTWRKMYNTKKAKIKFTYQKSPYTGNGGDNPDPKGEDRQQEIVVTEGVEKLREDGHCFYHFSPGYGKTSCAVETVRRLRRTTLWVAFNTGIQKQAYDEFKKFSDARVYRYAPKKLPPNDAQVVIIGLMTAAKLSVEYLSRFQMVVLDEVDQSTAKSFFPLYVKICPDYLLGLSATIKKANGLDKALFKYFGPQKEFLYRFIEKKNATVIKVQTIFEPTIEMNENQRTGAMQVDPHEITRSLAENPARTRFIANHIKRDSLKGQCFVLSPRKELIFALNEELVKTGYDVDYKTVGKTTLDVTKRILIGGMQGTGRGLDTDANFIFILGIPSNIAQFAGRLRDPNGTIYIYVDKYSKFELDWSRKCMPYLKKLGCAIKFQTGDEESQDYVVQTAKKVKETSILDEYM